MLEIRESQIEDIFATQLDDVKNILSVQGNISLISRQKKLPSGILDLLYICSNELLLFELKAVSSKIEFCDQVLSYKKDLLLLQSREELPSLSIKVYLACPHFSDIHKKYCYDNNVIPVTFSPYELLKNYYLKVKAISTLISLKPTNHGLWNLSLLNRILYSIENGEDINNLSKKVGLSKSTVGSYLRLSDELGLTVKDKTVVRLTTMGLKYIQKRDNDKPTDYINDEQAEIIKEFVIQNPFFSPAVFGIYSAVETIFALSKNYYPVPLQEAHTYFSYLSGKRSEWKEKASRDAFIMYSNYAINLGLLAKMGRTYYITPLGIRFVLLLELNKSILFVSHL